MFEFEKSRLVAKTLILKILKKIAIPLDKLRNCREMIEVVKMRNEEEKSYEWLDKEFNKSSEILDELRKNNYAWISRSLERGEKEWKKMHRNKGDSIKWMAWVIGNTMK